MTHGKERLGLDARVDVEIGIELDFLISDLVLAGLLVVATAGAAFACGSFASGHDIWDGGS